MTPRTNALPEDSVAIGKLFHIIHLTDDLPALEAWYDDVFAVRRGFLDHHYMEGEKRDASLVVLGDCVIETLAPAFRVDGWDSMPIGRFYNRFGRHWHSIAWYTDDAGEIWQRCVDNGIRVYVEGGRPAGERRPAPDSAIMTHPRDTIAQLEFMNPAGSMAETRDPRLQEGWDPGWWASDHPLGLMRLAYTTVLARDAERAKHVYADLLGGTFLHENTSKLTGTRNSYVLLGDTVVEIATPERPGTTAAADMAANGEIHHAAAFRVADLDRAERYLASKGVEVLERDDRTLLTDPATTHGVPFRWTIADVPGDPRT
jgi:catechol 2,3-dioxygenase-like lactoylglutathione lyase family enzyme